MLVVAAMLIGPQTLWISQVTFTPDLCTPPSPQRTVVIEFDSVDQAKAAHDSSVYQEVLAALASGAERDICKIGAVGASRPVPHVLPVCFAQQEPGRALANQPSIITFFRSSIDAPSDRGGKQCSPCGSVRPRSELPIGHALFGWNTSSRYAKGGPNMSEKEHISPFTVDASWYATYWLTDLQKSKPIRGRKQYFSNSKHRRFIGIFVCTAVVAGGVALRHFGLS